MLESPQLPTRFRARLKPRVLSLAVLATFTPVSHATEDGRFAVDPRLLLAAQAAVAAPPREAETRIEADRLDGRNEMDLRAQGSVRLQRGDIRLESEQLHYDQLSNEATAEGRVRVTKKKDEITGPKARLNVDTYEGEFTSPAYRLERQSRYGPVGQEVTQTVVSSGKADALTLEGENQYRLRNATYSTCPAPDPDWYLRVGNLKLDYDREQGEGTNSVFFFKGVPIAYLPWVDFPLVGNRQSGLLTPTYGSTTSTGFDFNLPYYINLAPNYDATLSPRWMSSRGLQMTGEFRYLMPRLSGQWEAEYLPNDQTTRERRSFFRVRHNQDFGHGFSGAVDYSEVSDRNYFADLSSRITATSQDHLLRQANLNYSNGTWWTSSLLVQRFQNLAGAVAYNRLPHFAGRATVPEWNRLSFAVPLEYTHFSHPTRDSGSRAVLYPQVSLPIQSPAFYVTPRLGMHMTRYQLERQSSTGDSSVWRSLPILAVDSGVTFERDVALRGNVYTQTLEPRLFYVRTPYREQGNIPVFDTAPADFNFAQLFSENVYVGHDRIADANQMTVGASSRFIDNASGIEWLRMALGQRYYFRDQRVTLPGEQPRSGRVADWLGAVSGRLTARYWVDMAYQYDPREHRSERGVFSLRYQPSYAKALSVSYRYKRAQSRDIDVAAQWPLWGNWYGVGRYNRNLKDDRLSEALAGLEYKADCWVLRMVWQTLLNTRQERNTARFIQLEFNGFASVGSNPVQLLKRSISGYDKINEPDIGDPVFGP